MPGASLRAWVDQHAATEADRSALRALIDAAQARAGQQGADRLDKLYALYREHTPESIQKHQLARTIATLMVLIEHDVTPETLQAALRWAARRDLAAQVVAGLIGYTGSWFVGTTVSLLMVKQGFKPGTSIAASAAVTAFGTRLMTRWLRLADTGPTWRRTVGGFDPDGKAVPAIRTRTGFAVSSAAYWPFLASLYSVTALWAHPSRAFTVGEARERAVAILDARRFLNYAATVGVALHRYFAPLAVERLSDPPVAVEHAWLDGRARPGTEGTLGQISGEHVLLGAIQELSGGTPSALRGAARSACQLLQSVPRTLLPCAAEVGDAPSAPGVVDTVAPPPGRLARDTLLVFGLMAVVAMTGLLRTMASDPEVSGGPHPGEPASTTAHPRAMDFFGDSFLVLGWGVLMAAADMTSPEIDSIDRDSKRVAGERHERLAELGRSAASRQPVVPSDTVAIEMSPRNKDGKGEDGQ
jgi:hypothetical protein